MNYDHNRKKRMLEKARHNHKSIAPGENWVERALWSHRFSGEFWALIVTVCFVVGMTLASCSGYVNGW